MIIPLGRGDWQRIKRKPDGIALGLPFCLPARHYARVDRVEINGNDDNCLYKRTVSTIKSSLRPSDGYSAEKRAFHLR